jgi:XTP/dITP diphosphohydrolase
MEIILATRNPSKALQIKAIFAGSGFDILTLDDAHIEGEAVEDGTSLEENALKKAIFAFKQTTSGAWTMADDTGIFIHALHDEPGIQAAYWGGAELSTEERMRFVLKQMEGIEDRSAIFRTCVALVSSEGKEYFFIGEAKGHLLATPRGTPQPKMPYSVLFVPEGSDRTRAEIVAGENRTWAEMTTEEENKISHRGRAFAQVRTFLETLPH